VVARGDGYEVVGADEGKPLVSPCDRGDLCLVERRTAGEVLDVDGVKGAARWKASQGSSTRRLGW
jgi:hypothetical protein